MDSDFFQDVPKPPMDRRQAYTAAYMRAYEILLGPGHAKGTRPKAKTVRKFLAALMREGGQTACEKGFRPRPAVYKVPEMISNMWRGI